MKLNDDGSFSGSRSINFGKAPEWTKEKPPVALDVKMDQLKEYERLFQNVDSSPTASVVKKQSTLDEQRRQLDELLDKLRVPPPPAKRAIRELPPPSISDFVRTMVVFPVLKLFEAIGKLTTRNHSQEKNEDSFRSN